jgi:predicted S18 family serine protease
LKSAWIILVLAVISLAQAFAQAPPPMPPKPHTEVNAPPTLLRRDNPPPTAPIPPDPAAITIKPSPSEDALVQAAKDAQLQHAEFTVAQQQAEKALSDKQKALNDKLAAINKQITDKLKADKHYRDLMAQFSATQADLQKAQADAGTAFQQQTGKVQEAIAKDNALIQGLIPVVRKENGLADTDSFDESSQQWKKAN